jgi:alpha-1,3-mannosyltransferase
MDSLPRSFARDAAFFVALLATSFALGGVLALCSAGTNRFPRGFARARRRAWSSVLVPYMRRASIHQLPVRRLLGVQLAATERGDALSLLSGVLKRCGPTKVAFANAHTLNLAVADPEYARLLSRFLVLNDGLGVDLASRMIYNRPFPGNLNGTDFIPDFLSSTTRGLRIYLVGGREGVVSGAARTIEARWPRHTVVGTAHGYFGSFEDSQRVTGDIANKRADLVLVGMGNPIQEQWIDAHAELSGARLLIGVGALFDFLSGRMPRAPAWIRRAHCEWVFRLLLEPRRLGRRYLVGTPLFLIRCMRDARRP